VDKVQNAKLEMDKQYGLNTSESVLIEKEEDFFDASDDLKAARIVYDELNPLSVKETEVGFKEDIFYDTYDKPDTAEILTTSNNKKHVNVSEVIISEREHGLVPVEKQTEVKLKQDREVLPRKVPVIEETKTIQNETKLVPEIIDENRESILPTEHSEIMDTHTTEEVIVKRKEKPIKTVKEDKTVESVLQKGYKGAPETGEVTEEVLEMLPTYHEEKCHIVPIEEELNVANQESVLVVSKKVKPESPTQEESIVEEMSETVTLKKKKPKRHSVTVEETESSITLKAPEEDKPESTTETVTLTKRKKSKPVLSEEIEDVNETFTIGKKFHAKTDDSVDFEISQKSPESFESEEVTEQVNIKMKNKTKKFSIASDDAELDITVTDDSRNIEETVDETNNVTFKRRPKPKRKVTTEEDSSFTMTKPFERTFDEDISQSPSETFTIHRKESYDQSYSETHGSFEFEENVPDEFQNEEITENVNIKMKRKVTKKYSVDSQDADLEVILPSEGNEEILC